MDIFAKNTYTNEYFFVVHRRPTYTGFKEHDNTGISKKIRESSVQIVANYY